MKFIGDHTDMSWQESSNHWAQVNVEIARQQDATWAADEHEQIASRKRMDHAMFDATARTEATQAYKATPEYAAREFELEDRSDEARENEAWGDETN